MHIDDLIEFGFRGLLERFVQGRAGVVHQVIEPVPSPTSQCAAYAFHKAIERADVPGVELKRRGFLPDRCASAAFEWYVKITSTPRQARLTAVLRPSPRLPPVMIAVL
jgi:hypothetical protein